MKRFRTVFTLHLLFAMACTMGMSFGNFSDMTQFLLWIGALWGFINVGMRFDVIGDPNGPVFDRASLEEEGRK